MIPPTWNLMPLGEAADILNGDRGKNYPSPSHRVESGIPFINAGHLDAGKVRLESMDYISQGRYELLGGGRVQEGDVLLCIRGSLGRVALVTRDIVPGAIASSLVILRPRPHLQPRFLLAYLMSPMGQQTIAMHDNGSAQPNVGARDVARFRVPLPPIQAQNKIAAILSAYDDLIENNTRRIQILEAMAQTIYREWFVEFRFPGHEDVRMADSELGPIPESWQVEAFSGLAEFVNGYAFKPSDWGNDGLPIVKIRELKEGVSPGTPRYPPDRLPAKYLIQSGALLFSWSADLDAYIWSYGHAWLNQHLFNVEPRAGMSKLFLFHSLRHRMDGFRSRALGTTMRHIKRSALGQVKTVVASAGLLSHFDQLVAPMHGLELNLAAANRNLRQTRDLLLPRLISGEIDVSNLDIGNAEPAA